MDYIALNNPQIASPYGVHYNSQEPIGGIRYYHAKPKKVKVSQKLGQTKVEVDLEANPSPEESQNILVAEKLNAIKEDPAQEILEEKPSEQITQEKNLEERNEVIEQDLIAIDLSALPGQEYFDKQREILRQRTVNLLGPMKPLSEYSYNYKAPVARMPIRTMNYMAIKRYPGDYVIKIQGQDVSFSEYGISRVEIAEEDRDWLRRAQNYFVSARENNSKIGSAEDYTSMEVLEGLWCTAVNVGVDPRRFIVQLYNESRFNPHVVGSAGERGIGQFLRSTANYLGYDWNLMSGGIQTIPYQAKASAEYVKSVGEVAYNGSGPMARAYKERISNRMSMINHSSPECVMKNISYCDT
jgi:hypothetical protein